MPDETVIPLRPTIMLPVRPNQGTIDLLRAALDMALKGEMQHLALAYTDDKGGAGGMYDGKGAYLLAAIARLEHRIHDWMDVEEAMALRPK